MQVFVKLTENRIHLFSFYWNLRCDASAYSSIIKDHMLLNLHKRQLSVFVPIILLILCERFGATYHRMILLYFLEYTHGISLCLTYMGEKLKNTVETFEELFAGQCSRNMLGRSLLSTYSNYWIFFLKHTVSLPLIVRPFCERLLDK